MSRAGGALGFSLSTLLLVAVLALVAWIVARHDPTVDVTRNSRNTLAPQTVRVLENLDRDIRALAFYEDVPEDRVLLQDLIDRYRKHTSRISLEFVDLDRRPELAEAKSVTNNRTVVLEAEGLEVRTIAPDESGLTGALVRLLDERPPRVAFLTGYGGASVHDKTPRGIAFFAEMLMRQNFTVQEWNLPANGPIPSDFDAVVLPAPEAAMPERERVALARYLEGGGRLLAMLEPLGSAGVDSFLAEWGLIAHEGFLYDPSGARRNIAGDGTERVALAMGGNPDHPITSGFNLPTLFPIARSLEATQPPPGGITPYRLVQSQGEAWLERDYTLLAEGSPAYDSGRDLQGPLGLAYALDVDLRRFRYGRMEIDQGLVASVLDLQTGVTDRRDTTQVDTLRVAGTEVTTELADATRVVAIGDISFATNANLLVRGNGDFAMACMLWLTERENRIALAPRRGSADPIVLTETQTRWLRLVGIGLGPAIPLVFSVLVVLQRRRWV